MWSKKKAQTAHFEHLRETRMETYTTKGTGIDAYYGY